MQFQDWFLLLIRFLETMTPSLYISKDNNLVKTLCRIFNEVTNSNAEPIAFGGAIYARAILELGS